MKRKETLILTGDIWQGIQGGGLLGHDMSIIIAKGSEGALDEYVDNKGVYGLFKINESMTIRMFLRIDQFKLKAGT